MFRTNTRYVFALVISTLLIQVAIVWFVINYKPAAPESSMPSPAQTATTGSAIPAVRSVEMSPADMHIHGAPGPQHFPVAPEVPTSEPVELDVHQDSDSSFRAEAINWQREDGNNHESGVTLFGPASTNLKSIGGATVLLVATIN